MSKEPGLLPKVEILVIGVLFLAFLLWAVSKCNDTRRQYQIEAEEEAAELARLDSMEEASLSVMEPLDTSIKPLNKPQATSPSQAPTSVYPPLYVIVKGLNMRSGPGLQYKKVDRLELHDVLYFMGEVTDTTQKLDLGEIETDEPWVKVKNEKGETGWVYGACVDYYKRELKGVETD